MSIPLVQDNNKDSINTSIIAIKRNIERINMLLGLVDNDSPDLSGFATKQELQDAVTQVETDLAPVDEVTVDNMQSVTSNAVARMLNGFKFFVTNENSGVSVTATKGIFFYGNGLSYALRVITETVTLHPTNEYWGDPAPGYIKIMIGFYIP